jgi:hypothetical protein
LFKKNKNKIWDITKTTNGSDHFGIFISLKKKNKGRKNVYDFSDRFFSFPFAESLILFDILGGQLNFCV